MRGRNNNNRRGPNPLTRNYESNGPDVKIRGSAQQIAEKYATLARDSHSSGDRVMAENYLQHAEHYNRIIAAAQAQMPIQNAQQQQRDEFDDDLDDDMDGNNNQQPQHDQQPASGQNNGNAGDGPQPVIEGMPAEVALNQDASGNQSGDARTPRPNNLQNGAEGDDSQRRGRRRGRGRNRFEDEAGQANATESEDAGLARILGAGEKPAAESPQSEPEAIVEMKKPAEQPAPEAADTDPVG